MTKHTKAIVVGAGISGATIANVLSNNNYEVELYDAQPSLGGACADSLTKLTYCQFHGSHIFHTNDKEVWHYLSKFTAWIDYEHRVKTLIHGKFYPMPLNKSFYNDYLTQCKCRTRTELEELSFDELRKVSKKMCDIIFSKAFRDYSLKQWGEIPDLSVLSRVKALRTTDEDRYFTDVYQGIPALGFTKLISNMLNDKSSINVNYGYFDIGDLYNTSNSDIPVFFTGSIDYLFDYKFGHLPYRTCEFSIETVEKRQPQSAAVINYPSMLYQFTRSHDYSWYIPTKNATIAHEYSKDFDYLKHNLTQRYYPISKYENLKLYRDYVIYAYEHFPNLILAGRQGLYKYMNIDQAVRSSLDIVNNFIQNDK